MDRTTIKKALGDRLLLDLLGDKWTALVMSTLCDEGGKRRFNAIKREVAGISQKSLTQCLRRLERNGLVSRTVVTSKVLAVEYSFTPMGKSMSEPIKAIFEWTIKNGQAIKRAQAKFDRNVDAES